MNISKHKMKRRFRWVIVKTKRLFKSSKFDKPKKPKELNETQAIVVDITVKSILDPKSKLYYDPETQECYVKKEDTSGDLYIFLEARNVKIINTIFGYDIPIDIPTENYLTSVFRREINKRRSQFKRDALSKVEHSLQKALTKISKGKS